MAARAAFLPLQVTVGEELPRVAVVHLVLVGECHVHAVLIQCPHAEREAAAALLCARVQGETHGGENKDNRLLHAHSSSSRVTLNESAARTSS